MKVIKKLTLLMTLLVISPLSTAELKKDLNRCANINISLERLGCYDELVKQLKLQSESMTQDIAKVTAEINDNKTIAEPVKQPEVSETTPTAEASESASNFGMEFVDHDAKIESVLVGEFTSWKKGMKLKLQNGQVWMVKSTRSGYRKMTNPTITITRGFFGSFDAKVEGLNSKAKVKRIK